MTQQTLKLTIESYNEDWTKYVDAMYPLHENQFLTNWIDGLLAAVSREAQIFEIGTGTGRDADYMEAKGYQVMRSDASTAAVAHQKAAGKQCVQFDVTRDNPGAHYNLVYANAVLLHLTVSEFIAALNNINGYLKPSGTLALVLKQGHDSGWSDAKGMQRFFQYWSEPELRTHLVRAGFSSVTIEQDPTHVWLYVVASR